MRTLITLIASTLVLAPALRAQGSAGPQSQGYPEDIAIVPHVGIALRSSNLEYRSSPDAFP